MLKTKKFKKEANLFQSIGSTNRTQLWSRLEREDKIHIDMKLGWKISFFLISWQELEFKSWVFFGKAMGVEAE